jgi:hypothetical protein
VSNGAWLGADGKKSALHAQSSLKLNAEIEDGFGDDWTVNAIKDRNSALIERVIVIWPTPSGHRALSAPEVEAQITYVSISDLISSGLLEIGDVLGSTWAAHVSRTATVRSDGTLEIDTGEVFDSLSGAARRVLDSRTAAGWHFWKQLSTNRQLTEIREEYRMRYNLITEDEEEDSE